jgi:ParB-like chromosome segregation protein Spo0J
MAERWQNRIVRYGQEAPDQLLANPGNWRVHPKHQQEALAGAMRQVGWVQDVIVNERSGFVVDGHLRVALAISEGQVSVPVKYVDLDPSEEALVLATLDPLSAMAVMDGEALNALLAETGTDDSALNALLMELAEDAEGSNLRSVGEDGGREAIGKEPLVKAAIAVAQVGIVERALAATGQVNRGEALLAICWAYLKEAAHEER